jgi:hypothetical protein
MVEYYIVVDKNGAEWTAGEADTKLTTDILIRPDSAGAIVYRYRQVWWTIKVTRLSDPALRSMLEGLPAPQAEGVLRVLRRLLPPEDAPGGPPFTPQERARLEFLAWLRRQGRLPS